MRGRAYPNPHAYPSSCRKHGEMNQGQERDRIILDQENS